MPNIDQPMGLIPVRHKNGAPYNGAFNEYYVPATYATALFIGDPVVITGTSNTAEVKGKPPGTLPEINKAGAGTLISGVIVGFEADPDDLSSIYNPASNERVVYVADDPELVFEIQEDSDAGALAAVSVGLNAPLVFGSGSTITGKSGAELDSSLAAVTATLPFKILRLVNRVDNAIGNQAKWEVIANLHTQRAALGI